MSAIDAAVRTLRPAWAKKSYQREHILIYVMSNLSIYVRLGADVLTEQQMFYGYSRMGFSSLDYPRDILGCILPRGSFSCHCGCAESPYMAGCLECHGPHNDTAQH